MVSKFGVTHVLNITNKQRVREVNLKAYCLAIRDLILNYSLGLLKVSAKILDFGR